VKPALLLLVAAALSAGEYTTYIGDPNTWGISQVLADSSGNTYVAGGRTFDLSFDSTRPLLVTEAIVAKLDSNGKTVLFAAIGGKGNDVANAVAVDSAGNVYIGGSTTSPNFPVRNGLFTTAARGFVVKYNPTASDVLWSTYFPAVVTALAADATGVYVSGTIDSGTLPAAPGLPSPTLTFHNYGAYLAKIAAGGDRLVYSTVVTGSEKPCGCCSSCFTSLRGASVVGVGIDTAGNAYFGGNSDVTDLPTTSGVMTPKGAGAWVAKVNAAGTALSYLTYLTPGGVTSSPNFTPDTSMGAFVVDAAGRVFVAGQTVDTKLSGAADGYALVLNPAGTAVVWASRLRGRATTATMDPLGNFWVAGQTRSFEFPNANGWSTGDDFIVGFNGTGGLSYSGRYPTGTATFTFAVDAQRLLHVGEPGGVVSAIMADAHPAVRPWFIGPLGGKIAPSAVTSIYGPHIGGQPVYINGIAAQILYSNDGQINLITPPDIANLTKATVRVGNGLEFTAAVQYALPQIYVAVNQDGSVNSPENPARVGSVMTIWVSGFGPVRPGDSVFAGSLSAVGQPVQELYAGAAPGMADGVGQINFVAPDASWIQLSAGGAASPPFSIYVMR
jgi:uncharacterized protein (TIGR03437 family)